ncbi:MAG TPA: glycine dehydrogenase (aminomethyl-transferring), partial [Aquificaceae bacterium]|nr:glycine dehydrogenase (aminomethyl-transferring) [Aquificaceae bacterium]
MRTDSFVLRHIGPRENEVKEMVATIGVQSLDELIDKTIPADIRLPHELNLPKAMSEFEYLTHIQELANKNKLFKNYIGLGYHPTILPGVIQRNIFENPGWYTAYTPYQAEIAQGRLEALLNFQTMVIELTGMEMANASLLDEGTAAGEAMIMLYNTLSKAQKKANAFQFFVSEELLPQTIDVLKTRGLPLGIELIIGNHQNFEFTDTVFGAILQYPAKNGQVYDYADFVKKANALEARVAVAADLLSLAVLTPPGEWGADVVIGTTQRFGIPMGYGGPHAAYFATKEAYKRTLPGRIIGVSVDKDGNRALRMALQMREQHIKREKATSNICTAQVLLAVMAGMYAVYHGPKGLIYIADKIQHLTATLSAGIAKLNLKQLNNVFFDTLTVEVSNADKVKELAESSAINFFYPGNSQVSISINETSNLDDINEILEILAKAEGKEIISFNSILENSLPKNLKRTSHFMTNEVFDNYHSETEMMRYIKKLERKDLSLNHSMISLGSCTMKLNAATEMLPLSWSNWGNMHPFVPMNQAQGYQEIFRELEKALNEITGFYATSLQPNSGAQGEYAGLMVIKAFHKSKGNHHRTICLIPASAHGTNPASAVMAGLKVVVTKVTPEGNIDVDDLREKALLHKDNLAALMVTYPSTHGVFESSIKEITKIIHDNGGQVYMDGANMNALVGVARPGDWGVDVMHFNLHKTFSTPHGGGGPGGGAIGVSDRLEPYLPVPQVVFDGKEYRLEWDKPKSVGKILAFYGHVGVMLRAFAYILSYGSEIKKVAQYAVLNANYLRHLLKGLLLDPYEGVPRMHEFVLSAQNLLKYDIKAIDLAKALLEKGFYAPTIYFPLTVREALMIEP